MEIHDTLDTIWPQRLLSGIMEVLPCSSVSYIADSDCLNQGSGTSFMYTGESNRVEHTEEVQVTDFKVDDLEINLEGPREEGSKWSPEGLPASEVHNNGDAYYAFEMDGQKFSFDSHDSEDEKLIAQDDSMGPCLESIESGQPIGDQERGLTILESKWLEKDESLSVWVKVLIVFIYGHFIFATVCLPFIFFSQRI